MPFNKLRLGTFNSMYYIVNPNCRGRLRRGWWVKHFGPEVEEVTNERSTPQNGRLYELFCSPALTRIISQTSVRIAAMCKPCIVVCRSNAGIVVSKITGCKDYIWVFCVILLYSTVGQCAGRSPTHGVLLWLKGQVRNKETWRFWDVASSAVAISR